MKVVSLQSDTDRSTPVAELQLQPASLDIWDKKYRLKSKDGQPIDDSVDGTFQRVARALAEVEATPELREQWYERFLWALRHGAIPAGRITSNAGALAHKPATSTINCTVSGTIEDSMDDILQKVHEAGLTLKAGCVAPDTSVITEHGMVSAERAVREQHRQMLCYDREAQRFEMRPIEGRMSTRVPREENIELVSRGVRLKTSVKHPVLVYRQGKLVYVRADEVGVGDALVHYTAPQQAAGKQLVSGIQTTGRELVARCVAFFQGFGDGGAVVSANGAPLCDFPAVGSMTSPDAHGRIQEHADRADPNDHHVMPQQLRDALEGKLAGLSHHERQTLGFYHGYHRRETVSRVWLDRWQARFPELGSLIEFARTLRPLEAVNRNLEIGETFYDFTVEGHHNYVAGEGGFMVIHNCGIGYEFSTLRPRGAYVSGAGAYTSGPLSFMDIYDKMCFTVSSAGGRRGAQMGTFDVRHPDVLEFIRAKREHGRLRQFNLSLLITEQFMEAVKADADWELVFPLQANEVEQDGVDLADCSQVIWLDWPSHKGLVVNEQGQVACKIYRSIKARRLWDMIMASTYDYAEPGFVLVDKVNRENNNWFTEVIRATNPCVTADTWVHTAEGPRQVHQLVGRQFVARVSGEDYLSGPDGFFKTATKQVVKLTTREGYNLRLTADHQIRRVSKFSRYTTESEWCAVSELRQGDRVVLHDHRCNPEWPGTHNFGQGYLIGLLVGDGTIKEDSAVLSVWHRQPTADGDVPVSGTQGVMDAALACAKTLPHRADFQGWFPVSGKNEYRLKLSAIRKLASEFGLFKGHKKVTPQIEQASSDFYRGFLRGFFDADGSVQGNPEKGVSIRLAQSDKSALEVVQRMLLRLGIASVIYADRRSSKTSRLPDGRGGVANYKTKAQHELVISGTSLAQYNELIGFADTAKQTRLKNLLRGYQRALNRERFVAMVDTISYCNEEDVFDVQIPGKLAFDANGIYAHNCGEQPLPRYGSCLLGSVNLTKFVLDPFTEKARFDWDTYREVVAVFTRMLDNVVEINGLPLAEQRHEIMSKRRHGMGYLGLGSTITMLRMKYGEADSLKFTEEVSREMALAGWQVALEMAREKGPAPILEQEFTVTGKMLIERPEMVEDGFKVGDKVKGKVLHARYSRYMQRVAAVAPDLVKQLAEVGARFTHHTSIAPTGTISLSLANNASNGIEPSFAHHYSRNVIREGRKTKEKVDVFSFEMLAYRELVNPKAMPYSDDPEEQLPDYFITAETVTPVQHVDIQAAAQTWIDSSISKTANVPTDYPYEDFKDIYLYAYEKGLKGCTTFRFNPEVFQGVLVKEQDLESTTYRFTLEDGSVVELRGNEEVEYDGEVHSAANLFDALKEGYYGRL